MPNNKYKPYDRTYNYRGSYGVGNKEKMHQAIGGEPERDYFPVEENYGKILNDWGTQYTTPLNLPYRIQREYAMDMANPKERLPEDMVSAALINAIPIYGYSHPPDFSTAKDFKQNDQVFLVQQAFLNASKQDQMFTNPNYFDRKAFSPSDVEEEVHSLDTDKVGEGIEPIGQLEFYSMDGSAAGYETNFLGGEGTDESYRVNSVEVMTAF